MKRYDAQFKGADVVLIEPDRDDYQMFFSNIFSFSARRAVCAHAYDATRKELLRRYAELAPILARHGLRLRREVLADPPQLAAMSRILKTLDTPGGLARITSALRETAGGGH